MKIKQVEPKNQPRSRSAAVEGVTYRACVECQMDAMLVHAMLSPWLENWSQPLAPMARNEIMPGPVGCELEFRLGGDGPNPHELLWLFDALPNGHVAADTLARAEHYTGVRRVHDAFDAPAQRPSGEVLDIARQSLGRYHRALMVEAERVAVAKEGMKRQFEVQRGVSQATSGVGTPGWMVLLAHGRSSEHTALRVSALGGDLGRTICGMSQVDARCLTLGV
jgi:hypothetical protein